MSFGKSINENINCLIKHLKVDLLEVINERWIPSKWLIYPFCFFTLWFSMREIIRFLSTGIKAIWSWWWSHVGTMLDTLQNTLSHNIFFLIPPCRTWSTSSLRLQDVPQSSMVSPKHQTMHAYKPLSPQLTVKTFENTTFLLFLTSPYVVKKSRNALVRIYALN
jgi:hypothetical protein